ncbi:MAG: hypothetical protein WD187_04025 [Candidatus Woykebacteria bacterium]
MPCNNRTVQEVVEEWLRQASRSLENQLPWKREELLVEAIRESLGDPRLAFATRVGGKLVIPPPHSIPVPQEMERRRLILRMALTLLTEMELLRYQNQP